MTEPILSVIIPCYNSGQYLPDALASLKNYPDTNVYEVIIVNDGSTDAVTLNLLTRLQQEEYHIIHQENKGPAAARNTGVKAAKGQYLLLLDGDNKVKPAYITKGIAILNGQPDVAIVHAKPAFFGDSITGRFETGKFEMLKMLAGNYIDTCALVRKNVWDALGGQDENPVIIGHEDWDFYIRAGAANYQFYYINEPLFDYRVLQTSLVTRVTTEAKTQALHQYLFTKHQALYTANYKKLYNWYYVYQEDQQQPFRSFIKYFYNKYFKKP